jgi:hypothetical protein
MVTVGDVIAFFKRMDKDMDTTKEMSIEEQDRLCREKGWPTITEQKRYWMEHPTIDKRIEALEGRVLTLAELTNKLASQFHEHQQSFLQVLDIIKRMQK